MSRTHTSSPTQLYYDAAAYPIRDIIALLKIYISYASPSQMTHDCGHVFHMASFDLMLNIAA